MPRQSINPEDWNLAMVMFANGVRPQEISQRLGISTSSINTRASRDGWQLLLAKAREYVLRAYENVAFNAEIQFKTAVVKRLGFLAQSLPDKAMSQAKELGIQKDLEPALRNAKAIFGWNESNGTTQPLVRINVLGSAQVQTSNGTIRQSTSAADPTPTG